MKIQTNNNELKILISFGFLFVIIAQYLILVNVPHNIPSLSIYSEVNIFYWIFYILALLIGTLTVFEGLNSNYWKLGILIIVLSNLTIILLPLLKGYVFSGSGDHLTHLALVKDILITGHVTTSNVYPATHILISNIYYLSKIPLQFLINIISPIFYLLFIIFTYLLAKELIDKEPAIIATLVSTVLTMYYYVQIFPMGYAFLLFPFFFYIYFKNDKKKGNFDINYINISINVFSNLSSCSSICSGFGYINFGIF